MTAIEDGELVVVRQDDRTIVTAVFDGHNSSWALMEVDLSRATSRASRLYASYLEATHALRVGAVQWLTR